jgi:hypothetical protein
MGCPGVTIEEISRGSIRRDKSGLKIAKMAGRAGDKEKVRILPLSD